MEVINRILLGDSLEIIRQFESSSLDLIITSPPYNIGKEYEKVMDIEQYKQWMHEYIREFYRLIKDTGSVVFQVGNYIDKGKVYPLDCILFDLFLHEGFIPRNRIIWHFGHGMHCKNRFSGRHETLLWFTKTDDYKFNLDLVRVPQKYPNKKAYKGNKKGQLSGNPLGKNPSDVWEISNVKNNHPEKTDHPCQFPIELVSRCIKSMTDINDVVMDPFLGSGTTLVSAIQEGRNGIGIEKDERYCQIASERIRAV
jgi:adenine-specific DNA-methyltransferase